MTEYKNPLPINRNEAVKSFLTGSNNDICDTLLAVTLHDEDWKWVQMQCLHFLKHDDPNISGLAATCLGHLARIHRKIDGKLVTVALKQRLKDAKISGRVQDALDDIETFIEINT